MYVVLPNRPCAAGSRKAGEAEGARRRLVPDQPDDPDAHRYRPRGKPESKRHICFLVSDLATAKTAVQAQAIPIEDEGTAEGLIRFFIRDPAGNRIEIGQRA